MFNRIERLIYSIKKFGYPETAKHENFESTYGFRNHVRGLLNFVKDVDEDKWELFIQKLQ